VAAGLTNNGNSMNVYRVTATAGQRVVDFSAVSPSSKEGQYALGPTVFQRPRGLWRWALILGVGGA
jgi:hypothetical protein